MYCLSDRHFRQSFLVHITLLELWRKADLVVGDPWQKGMFSCSWFLISLSIYFSIFPFLLLPSLFSFLYFLNNFFICLFVPLYIRFPPFHSSYHYIFPWVVAMSSNLTLAVRLQNGGLRRFLDRRKQLQEPLARFKPISPQYEAGQWIVHQNWGGGGKMSGRNCSVLLTSGAGDETKFNNNGFKGIVKQVNVFRFICASM